MKDNCKEICRKALDTWGKLPQMMMVLEEMAELQKEILKNINRKVDNVDDIIGEVADVYIMLEQLKMNYDIEEAVEAQIEKKLTTVVAERLKKWENKCQNS